MSPSTATEELAALDHEIDARVALLRSAHPDWPCTKGCDACCHRLAALPQLTPPEADRLRAALAELPSAKIAAIHARFAALGPAPTAPITCPLLDPQSGACPVYAARPIACRSYGFYVERDKGLYCQEIAARVAAGSLNDAIWGNHAAIERRLSPLGPRRALNEWLVPDTATCPAVPQP